MNDKTKKIVAIVVVVFFAIAFVLPLMSIFVKAAPTQEQLSQELKEQAQKKSELQKNINDVKGQKKEVNGQKKDILQEKKRVDGEVKSLEDDVDNLNVGIVKDNQDISEISANLAEATIISNRQYETFKKRVRVMYEQGPSGYLEVLLSAQNFTDFLNRFEIIKQIATYDKDMLSKLEQTRKTIEDNKKALETKKQAKVVKVTSLSEKVSNLENKQVQRDALINDLAQTEKELSQEESALVKTLKAVEAEEQQTRADLRSLMSPSGSSKYAGGQMSWPSPGYYNVTSPFGYRFHPVLKVNKLHTGVDIGAPYGAKVVAVNSGKVIKAGYNGAYGNHVIIDHGGGIATLYAHASSLNVSVGQEVSRDQQIMKVGSTGYSTGAHLHFEIIVNGDPVNPMGYY